MDTSLQEYPALLASLQPSQAATVVNDRVKVINKVNSDIADWLQERRRIEDAYIQGLRKLARRPQQDHGASLGVFQVPWKRIISSTESMAQSHETLAQKIETDVERPLRDYAAKNLQMQTMPKIQSDLAGLAKTMENAQKKAEKMKSKSADKSASAISGAADAKQQWESRAPYVFEQLQAVDESRVNHLRDVLTQLETHEVDLLERNRKTAEGCLNALLSVETNDEIKNFATKVGGGSGPGPSTVRHTPSTSATSGSGSAPLPPPPRINHDDTVSQRSGRSSHATPASAAEPQLQPQPRQTPFGGLRRLGTVMGRRKSVVHGSGQGFPSDKKGRTPFGTGRRGETSRDLPPVSPSPPPTGTQSVNSHDDSSSTRPGSAVRGTSNDMMEPISEGQKTPTGLNDVSSGDTAVQEPKSVTRTSTGDAQTTQTDAEGFSMRPQTLDEITRLQREALATEEATPNLTIRDQPIHEDENAAQQAMSDVASRLRLQAQQTGIRRNAGTLRGRRDVRNTVFVPDQSTPEQELQARSPGSAMGAISPAQPPSARSVATPPHVSEDRTVSDTTSVHSSHTLHSLSGPVLHPELHEPGLSASIIETVSTWFDEGAPTKSFVVGELALAYNPTADLTPGPDRIRLDNFPILEKVAANPNFVTEAPSTMMSLKGKEKEIREDEKTGEYNISLPAIARSAPTVAFKYQVHLDPSNLSSYSPVIFTPVWDLQETQASVIIHYTLNKLFTSLQSLTLRNVIVTVNLDLSPDEEPTNPPREVARATQALMHPNTGATFRRKLSAVAWKMPELELQAGEVGRFLARFTTTVAGPRKGKVEAKFEVRNSGTETRLGVSAATPGPTPQKEIDPFADEIPGIGGAEPKPNLKAWKEVPVSRKLVAGKYVSS